MADRQFRVGGNLVSPADWVLPDALQIIPKAIYASFDGSGAASAYVPVLVIKNDAGRIVGRFPAGTTIVAGASADASWFRGVTESIDTSKVAVVGARIEMHASQSINSSVDTNMTYDTVGFDTAGMANLGADNRILTVTTSGLYLVMVERAWQANATNRRLIGVTKNNYFAGGGAFVADNAQVGIPGGGQTTSGIATLLSCVAGDFIATGANQDSGVALTTGGGAPDYFAAILVGTT